VEANEPVEIYTTTNPAEAEILKNRLESEGIKCDLGDENQGSFTGLFAIRVLVRAWDEERARKMIASHTSQHGGHPRKYGGD